MGKANAKTSLKAAFFEPYLDTLGGGERYFLSLAAYLGQKGWLVDVFGFQPELLIKAEQMFGLSLKRVNINPINIFQINVFNKLNLLRNYDLSFFYSNGSVPWLGAKKNLLHFQVPFQKVGGKGWLTRLKLKKIDAIVCNSFFTKRFIDREFGVNSRVVYPPVAVDQFSSGKKENLILSVGRFTDLLHNKRQDVLVAAFKKLINRTKLDYRLVLAGGAKEGKKLVRELTDKIQDYPIEIIPDLPFGELKKLYARARIFWTASGFGVDEEKNPESVEHFGITTAEAMAAGCVPIVIAKGGQKEIVDSGKDGFLWQQPSELIELTENIINRPTQLKIIARAAIKKARKFSYQQFCQEYEALIA